MPEVCCICLEEYPEDPEGVAVTSFPCGHQVHRACYHQYTRSTMTPILLTCPLCRHPIFEDPHSLAPRPTTLVAIVHPPHRHGRTHMETASSTDVSTRRAMIWISSFFLLMLLACMLLVSIGYLVRR